MAPYLNKAPIVLVTDTNQQLTNFGSLYETYYPYYINANTPIHNNYYIVHSY